MRSSAFSSPLFPLFSLVLLTIAMPCRAADSPFAGQWKIIVPQQFEEVSLWIVHIDKQGKEAKILAGLRQYDTTTVRGVKTTPNRLALSLTRGSLRFEVSVEASPATNKRLLGSVRIGSTILPGWLEPTSQVRLDEKKAVRPPSGQAELEEARQRTDIEERHKALRAVASRHPATLTPFLVQQILLADLVQRKASASAFARVIADYRKLAAAHGDEMLLGANLDLSRHLLSYPLAADLCVNCARATIKLLRAEHPIEMKISGHLTLAAALVAAGKKGETKAVAEDLARLATAYLIAFGDSEETKLHATMQIATVLVESSAEPVGELGLVYARMAVEQLKTTTPTPQRVAVYAVLLRGARHYGKPNEVAKTQALLDFFEGQLDETYRKEAIPFPVEKAAARKSKSPRIVLVELFTTAEARPCIAADMAFDAGYSTYPTTEVVFLRYHVPVSSPDLLTSPAALARREFYSADIEETVPALLVDGQMTPAVGGSAARGKASFEVLRKSIDRAREKKAEAQITLEWREGRLHAKVSNLTETGDKVRLRFAVVEEEVRYVGESGRRLHGQIVRGFLGNAAGIKLDRKESSHSATLEVAALRKSLTSYLAEHSRKEMQRADPPLKLNKLAIVVFIQHEDTKKVYQAARIEIPVRK